MWITGVSLHYPIVEGFVHRGVTCNNCSTSPIRGIRYKCSNCVDYDLCEGCEQSEPHIKTHVFLKIRIPLPPLANPKMSLVDLLYPGGKGNDPETLSNEKASELQKKTSCMGGFPWMRLLSL